MASLVINGLTFPGKKDSFEESIREVGSTSPAADGTMRKSRIALKTDLKGEATVQDKSVAASWANLIRGLGHRFSYDTSLYSADGFIPSTFTGCSVDAAEKKYGAASMAITNGNSAVYSDWWTVGATALLWRQTASAGGFTHFIVTYDGSTHNYWQGSGVKTAGAPGAWVTLASNDIVLTGDGATRWYDDLVLLPYVIPDAWASSIFTWRNTTVWSNLPHLIISGDNVQEATTRTVLGSASTKLVTATVASTRSGAHRNVSIELVEV
jgi:hypothetical protein